MRWLSRVVTVVVIAALFAGGWLWLRTKMPATSVGESFMTCAAFRDGTRLAVGSPVLIAGVRVGEITRLRVQNNLARIDMRLVNVTKVPVDSWITKRAYSPFGDSYVEIIPSGGEAGAPSARMLASGECITKVLEASSTDRILRVIDRAMPKVESGLERIHEVAANGRKWASGTLEDAMLDMNRWLDEGHIDRPIDKANAAVARIDSATASAANAVSDARPDFETTLDRIQRGVRQARTQMAELKVSLHDGLENARSGLDSIDPTIADMREVMTAIDEGRSGSGDYGTLGKLVNDPGLADSIEEATASAADGIGGAARFRSWLGLRFEYNVFARRPRIFVTAEVRARTDKFYLIELERGPLGDFPDDTISDAVGVPEYTRHQELRDGVRFTAQFGKTLGNWFQIRGGIKESTFGLGSDILIGEGRLKLSADLYGSFTRTPRVKLASALAVYRSIYLLAGVDDALNKGGYLNIRRGNTDVPAQFDQIRYGRDYFLGAALHFNDADLSMLLRVYGALLVALL